MRKIIPFLFLFNFLLITDTHAGFVEDLIHKAEEALFGKSKMLNDKGQPLSEAESAMASSLRLRDLGAYMDYVKNPTRGGAELTTDILERDGKLTLLSAALLSVVGLKKYDPYKAAIEKILTTPAGVPKTLKLPNKEDIASLLQTNAFKFNKRELRAFRKILIKGLNRSKSIRKEILEQENG